MAFRLTVWIVAVVGLCVATALALLPPDVRRLPYWRDEAVWNTPVPASRRLAAQLDRAADLHRVLATRDSVLPLVAAAGPGTATVIAPRGFPAGPREEVDALLAPFRRAASGNSNRRVVVALVADTAAPSDLPLRSTYGLDLAYVLPEATDGLTCGVIMLVGRAGLRGRERQQMAVLLRYRLWRWPDADPAAALLGPCAFYAMFGDPGPAVREWLERADFLPATLPEALTRADGRGSPLLEAARYRSWDWWRARRPWQYELDPDLEVCAAGDARRCGKAVLAPTEPRFPFDREGFVVGGELEVRGVPNLGLLDRRGAHALGVLAPRFLSDVVADLGIERFRRLWTSGSSLEDAFLATAGQPLDAWTRSWAQQHLGVLRRGPRPPVLTVVVVMLMVALTLGGGAVLVARRQVS